MNIQEIMRLTKKTSPHFFNYKTMSFFGQSIWDFSITKKGGRYLVQAPIKDRQGKVMGLTVRYFNPKNNQLELK